MNEWNDFVIENGVLTAYQGPGGDVVIPEEVTRIGSKAFANHRGLERVTIPGNVTYIGPEAFAFCDGLAQVTMLDGVEMIGNSAFFCCDHLTELRLPAGLESIGESAFHGCNRLESVVIPEGVTELCDGAFRNCGGLRRVTLPESLQILEEQAFFSCHALEHITIPGLVEEIGESAFSFCGSLRSVTLLEGVKAIGPEAFNYCSGLESVLLPESVQDIGFRAFEHCERLARVTLPAGLNGADLMAFRDCPALADESGFVIFNETLVEYHGPGGEITVPAGVKRICEEAFWGRDSITGVTLPDSLRTIDDDAFVNCDNLARVTLNEGLEHLGAGVFTGCEALKSLAIPDSVTEIEEYLVPEDTILVISDPERLPQTLLPGALIGYALGGGSSEDASFAAYARCIRARPEETAKLAMRCRELLHLICREGLIAPEDVALYAAAARATGNPERIAAVMDYEANKITAEEKEALARKAEREREQIFRRKLARQGKTDLRGLVFHFAWEPMLLGWEWNWKEELTKRGASISPELHAGVDYVVCCDWGPEDVLRKARAMEIEIITEERLNDLAGTAFRMEGTELVRYCGAGGDVVVPDGVTVIGENAFSDVGKLKSVSLPRSVTEVRCELFRKCPDVRYRGSDPADFVIEDGELKKYVGPGGDVTVPAGVKRVGKSAFFQKKGVVSVRLPEGVERIENEAFRQCEDLRLVTIPESVSSIGSGAFIRCISLEQAIIPEGVTALPHAAFLFCANLEQISLPETLRSIGMDVFYGCHSLLSVTLPERLRSIGGGAFGLCQSLTTLHIPEAVEFIGDSAFQGCYRLESIALPPGLKHLGTGAFQRCEALTEITIPAAITTIGKRMFDGCFQLERVTLPAGVASIRSEAFLDCERLRCLVIPDGGKIRVEKDSVNPGFPIDISDPGRLPKALRPNAAVGFALRGEGRESPRFERYAAYLRAHAGDLAEQAMESPALLSLLCRERLLTAEQTERYLELAQALGKPALVAELLDYQSHQISEEEKAALAQKRERQRERVFRRRLAREGREGVAGLVFYPVGRLRTYDSRASLRAILAQNGARMAASLTTGVDFAVRCDCGERDQETLRRAEAMGIEIISEERMNELTGRRR